MAPRYLLKVGTDFAAAHSLRDYPGECSRLHGHNWKLEVEVAATELDEVGIGMDFKTIKSAARALAGELDHRYLNELEPFARVNPTAENIAAYFYRQLSASLNTGTTRVHAVTLWETDTACVRYTEDNPS
jgi:6-pyruvoyltetrahydropterin/6-carboxytetrahydropterin synthase